MGEREGMSRRDFLKMTGAALGLAGAGALLTKETGSLEWADKEYKKLEENRFQEAIEREKNKIREDIERGLKNQQIYAEKSAEHNKLIDEIDSLPAGANELQEKKERAHNLRLQIDQFVVIRGNLFTGLLKEANPYAEQLLKDEQALTNLAIMRVILQENHADAKTFEYWHNFALAYVELGKLDPQVVRSKLTDLFSYKKNKDKSIDHPWESSVQLEPEYILFYLLDKDFDLSLDAKGVDDQLSRERPDWRNYPDTHTNRDSYGIYNDTSAFNIFELNQLRAVTQQLNKPEFQHELFCIRDKDLEDFRTELGGVIPLPHSASVPEVVLSDTVGNNGAYVTPAELEIRKFKSASQFHFHAINSDEPADVHGPSGADEAFFNPGVVFSSVNQETILAHFYTSRKKPHGEFKNDVVCLGSVVAKKEIPHSHSAGSIPKKK